TRLPHMPGFRKPHGNRGDDRGPSRFGQSDSSRPRFGGDRPGGYSGGRDDRPPQKFRATCSQCGKSCEVPFRPSGQKPVYCNECFSAQKGGQPRSFERRDREYSAPPQAKPPVEDKRIDEIRRQLDLMSSKIDNILQTMMK